MGVCGEVYTSLVLFIVLNKHENFQREKIMIVFISLSLSLSLSLFVCVTQLTNKSITKKIKNSILFEVSKFSTT